MIVSQFVTRVLIAILSCFLLWAGGFVFFALSLPQKVADDHTITEAIVVLTGGRERLKTGFQLLCAQQARMIFISGVHPEETLKSVLKSVEFSKGACNLDWEHLAASTYLGYVAKNTKENAQETATWVNKMSITSLRLVTATYHIPRSLMELRHTLPHATIIPHPVFPHGHGQFWWWHGNALYLVFSEYNKFLWGFVRIHFF